VHQEVYGSGFHVVLKPFDVEEMYLFQKDIQVIYLAGAHEVGEPMVGSGRPAHIQTSDGFFVDVDVSILYKIVDPYLVFTRLGTGRLFETNGIVPKAEPVLKQALGELTTEEFYNSPLRTAKAKLAKDMLNRDLATNGVQVDQLMVRYFRYSDEIQRNIEEKKLKDQLVFKNQAEGRAATEGAKLKQMIQEGEATVKIKIQEGSAYITTKEAERDLYVRSQARRRRPAHQARRSEEDSAPQRRPPGRRLRPHGGTQDGGGVPRYPAARPPERAGHETHPVRGRARRARHAALFAAHLRADRRRCADDQMEPIRGQGRRGARLSARRGLLLPGVSQRLARLRHRAAERRDDARARPRRQTLP
jgi:regulator of protease activity HflC (stomatin/prohibitin superfamily)